MKQRLDEEFASYQAYRSAQESPTYVRVGAAGANLLNQTSAERKGRVDRLNKEYKNAMERLCAFEESFAFPMHLLTDRKEDKQKIKEELAVLKEYVKSVKTCVDGMSITANEIVSDFSF